MNKTELAAIIASRLEDMATQVEKHYAEGNLYEAAILRESGLRLASAFDEEEDFLVLGDLSAI